MSGQNPSGEMKYWYNGLPMPTASSMLKKTGPLNYWYNGLPLPFINVPVGYMAVVYSVGINVVLDQG